MRKSLFILAIVAAATFAAKAAHAESWRLVATNNTETHRVYVDVDSVKIDKHGRVTFGFVTSTEEQDIFGDKAFSRSFCTTGNPVKVTTRFEGHSQSFADMVQNDNTVGAATLRAACVILEKKGA